MKRKIEIDYGFEGFVVEVTNDGKLVERERRGNALGLDDSVVSEHHPLHIPEICLAGYARLIAGTLSVKHAIDGYQRNHGLLERSRRTERRAVSAPHESG